MLSAYVLINTVFVNILLKVSRFAWNIYFKNRSFYVYNIYYISLIGFNRVLCYINKNTLLKIIYIYIYIYIYYV